jgi:hypothetical protein
VLTCPAENIPPDATALGGGDHRLPASGAGFSPLAAVGDLPVPVICWQRDWS